MSSEYTVTRDPKTGEYPAEQKVVWATASSYATGVAMTGITTIVQDERVPLLIGFLPEWLEPFVLALLPAAAAYVAGWNAKHQKRQTGFVAGQAPGGP